MKVLMITGDKKMGPGHPRFDLQAAQVEQLAVLYWGRGVLWPTVPPERFDVVTAQDPFWRGLFAWRVARRCGARFNVQIHADLGAQSFVRHVLARIVLSHADSIRVVSEKIKEQVERGGVQAPVTVLPVFVDVQKFYGIVRRPHARPTILWLGRFEEEKNPLEAISVLEEVRKAGIDAQLVMLGEGSMRAEILKRANNLPDVEILPWQDPLVHFETADVVLCTSWQESWGASIVEALAAGVPVVAPDVGVAREAGAIVVERSQLAQKTIEVLRSGSKGTLTLPLLAASEWAAQWRASLLAQ